MNFMQPLIFRVVSGEHAYFINVLHIGHIIDGTDILTIRLVGGSPLTLQITKSENPQFVKYLKDNAHA